MTSSTANQNEPEIHETNWNAGGLTIRIRVTLRRNAFSQNIDHLVIESIDPLRHPLPISDTGFKSVFLAQGEVDTFGGAVAATLQALNDEALAPRWLERREAARQGSLF